MPWKSNSEGLVLVNSNPVWVDDDGKETVVDFPDFREKLSSANHESADRRAKVKELEQELESLQSKWDGLGDPSDVKKALKDAEKLQKRLESAKGTEGTPERIAELEGEIESLNKRLETATSEKDSLATELGQFRSATERSMKMDFIRGSKFFAAVNGNDRPLSKQPPESALNNYGDFLTIEEGHVVGVWPEGHPKAGKKILNRNGEIANRDEVFEAVFEDLEWPKSMLWESQAKGSGSGNKTTTPTAASHQPKLGAMDDDQKVAYIRDNNLTPEEFGQRLAAEASQ